VGGKERHENNSANKIASWHGYTETLLQAEAAAETSEGQADRKQASATTEAAACWAQRKHANHTTNNKDLTVSSRSRCL